MATDASSESSLYLIPGMKAEIWIPINTYSNNAMFPTQASKYKVNDVEYTLTNAFYEESKGTVGEITDVLTDKFGVIYWHKKPERNAIWFVSAHPGIKVVWNVISVPIHDHSSIVQGGPAYGTYFSDDQEAVGE